METCEEESEIHSQFPSARVRIPARAFPALPLVLCCLSCSSLFPFLVADWAMLSSVARMGVHTCRHELPQIPLGASQQFVAHNLHAVAQFHKALLPL